MRHVATRFVEAKRRGLNVVGTVSAMGKSTDSLIALAEEVSPAPNPRELDMLLSTGERIACALVAMAIHDLGEEAVSYTGSQAIVTDSAHGKAKIREIRGDRIEVPRGGKIVLVAGFQGFSRDTMEITTLGRGGTDATAVALAARSAARARSTRTSPACTRPTRGSSRTRASSRSSPTTRCSRWPRPAPRC